MIYASEIFNKTYRTKDIVLIGDNYGNFDTVVIIVIGAGMFLAKSVITDKLYNGFVSSAKPSRFDGFFLHVRGDANGYEVVKDSDPYPPHAAKARLVYAQYRLDSMVDYDFEHMTLAAPRKNFFVTNALYTDRGLR